MSSQEIAELTGKRHADVMRVIRNMLEQLGLDERNFASVYRDAKGEERPCYNLPRNLTVTLVTGYSIPMRHAVVTRSKSRSRPSHRW
ncbi:Rha family transcriptional regulator [Methylobacterium sp. NFXW15]